MSVVSAGILADVREARRAVLDRLRAAGADGPDNPLVLPRDTLSPDQQSLLDDMVRRGLVVEHRGGYYLDEQAIAAADGSSTLDLLLAVITGLAVVVGGAWFISTR